MENNVCSARYKRTYSCVRNIRDPMRDDAAQINLDRINIRISCIYKKLVYAENLQFNEFKVRVDHLWSKRLFFFGKYKICINMYLNLVQFDKLYLTVSPNI